MFLGIQPVYCLLTLLYLFVFVEEQRVIGSERQKEKNRRRRPCLVIAILFTIPFCRCPR